MKYRQRTNKLCSCRIGLARQGFAPVFAPFARVRFATSPRSQHANMISQIQSDPDAVFSALRLPINVDTAHFLKCWRRHCDENRIDREAVAIIAQAIEHYRILYHWCVMEFPMLCAPSLSLCSGFPAKYLDNIVPEKATKCTNAVLSQGCCFDCKGFDWPSSCPKKRGIQNVLFFFEKGRQKGHTCKTMVPNQSKVCQLKIS